MKMPALKLGHKGLILVAVPLAFELLFIGTMWNLLQEVEQERAAEARAQAIASHVNKLLRCVIVAGAMTSGDALKRRRDRLARSPLLKAPEEFRILEELTRDDPEQLQKIYEMEKLIDEGVALLDEVRSLTRNGQSMQAVFQVKKFTMLANIISDKADIVIADCEAIEEDTTVSQEATRARVKQLLLVGVLANIFVALALAAYFNRGTTRRLEVLVDNTFRVAQGKSLNPPVGGGDEIAYLDQVFSDMARALSQSEQYKRELTAMVTHDLRSPLAAVQAVLEMLQMGVYGQQSQSAQEHLGMAEANTSRVLRLINDLLDIEKMKAGKLTMNLAPAEVADVLRRSADAVATLAEQKKLSIHVQSIDAMVSADAERLVQVLINLLTNAVKFSPDGGNIVLEAKNIDEGEIEIAVTDTGCGIAPEYHQAIFEKFEQGTSAPTKIADSSGTGLGLPISKAIVEQHGGKIGVRSNVGQGSTFWFRLPKQLPATGTPDVADLNTADLNTADPTPTNAANPS